jgi:hypothetical protein
MKTLDYKLVGPRPASYPRIDDKASEFLEAVHGARARLVQMTLDKGYAVADLQWIHGPTDYGRLVTTDGTLLGVVTLHVDGYVMTVQWGWCGP